MVTGAGTVVSGVAQRGPGVVPCVVPGEEKDPIGRDGLMAERLEWFML